MTYISGDPWKICDVCGFRYRASQTKKRWDGLIVCFADHEERHPQDFVRGRVDNQNVPDPRPESATIGVGPLTTQTTAAAAAGATTLAVASSAGFLATHSIGVVFSDGSVHRKTINTVPDGLSITLTLPLSGSVPSGAFVIDYSAVSQPDIG